MTYSARYAVPTHHRWILCENEDAGVSVGGRVISAVALGTLTLGQAVCWISGTDRGVNTSTAAAVHRGFAGIVVGGTRLMAGSGNFACANERGDYGVLQAATVNQEVLIQIDGIAFAIMAGGYAVGTVLVPDTGTAGRVLTAADIGVTTGATAVTSSAANGAGTVTGINGRGIGKLLEVSTLAGQVRAIHLQYPG